mmetsp:Transcript_503/g.1012  ORF Transcript_503/g.1012 Transcript_503/m.1012 type:complete len:306 (+) Transcript_503:472-1389(+)
MGRTHEYRVRRPSRGKGCRIAELLGIRLRPRRIEPVLGREGVGDEGAEDGEVRFDICGNRRRNPAWYTGNGDGYYWRRSLHGNEGGGYAVCSGRIPTCAQTISVTVVPHSTQMECSVEFLHLCELHGGNQCSYNVPFVISPWIRSKDYNSRSSHFMDISNLVTIIVSFFGDQLRLLYPLRFGNGNWCIVSSLPANKMAVSKISEYAQLPWQSEHERPCICPRDRWWRQREHHRRVNHDGSGRSWYLFHRRVRNGRVALFVGNNGVGFDEKDGGTSARRISSAGGSIEGMSEGYSCEIFAESWCGD